MDVTNVFKACVKTAKTRSRTLGISEINVGVNSKHSTTKFSNDILNSKRHTTKDVDEFTLKAKEIVSSISKLRDFLLEHRKAYINNAGYLSSNPTEMDDNERDHIDLNAHLIMRTCAKIVRELKQEASKQEVKKQHKEHRDGVFHLIDRYLKDVCDTYGEQRAIRVKRAIDKQRLLRLEPEIKRRKNSLEQVSLSSSLADDTTNNKMTAGRLVATSFATSSAAASAPDIQPQFDEALDGPSAEDIQMFELENERMYNELSTLGDEVRHIEGQVVEISKLQEVFTSKILQQEHDLERIADTVVGTTENIKDANEEIREAMKKSASFRVWILFFLIVMAFSLLFLDWYNP